ncbi:MAG: hypothetical protein GY858_04750, partial [Candidatus Omnitrophica bacterium]|nr:hypothetical protein [Candidatus Omnitrophota bacterium]
MLGVNHIGSCAVIWFCLKGINPDQPGCIYDQQCNAVWPGSTCQKSICRCPFNLAPKYGNDGPVCYLPGVLLFLLFPTYLCTTYL